MNGKYLGKIKSIKIGYCGYNDKQLGFQFRLSGEGWETDALIAAFSKYLKPCKETLDNNNKQLLNTWIQISDIMDKARVKDVTQLIGKPIEARFENNTLKDWRILTEVL